MLIEKQLLLKLCQINENSMVDKLLKHWYLFNIDPWQKLFFRHANLLINSMWMEEYFVLL